MSASSDAHTQAGARLYERLSDAQKMLLSHELRQCLDTTCDYRDSSDSSGGGGNGGKCCRGDDVRGAAGAVAGGSDRWSRLVDDTVTRVLARRAASGDALELCDVVDEVLPIVCARIPDTARQLLFRRVTVALAEARDVS